MIFPSSAYPADTAGRIFHAGLSGVSLVERCDETSIMPSREAGIRPWAVPALLHKGFAKKLSAGQVPPREAAFCSRALQSVLRQAARSKGSGERSASCAVQSQQRSHQGQGQPKIPRGYSRRGCQAKGVSETAARHAWQTIRLTQVLSDDAGRIRRHVFQAERLLRNLRENRVRPQRRGPSACRSLSRGWDGSRAALPQLQFRPWALQGRSGETCQSH